MPLADLVEQILQLIALREGLESGPILRRQSRVAPPRTRRPLLPGRVAHGTESTHSPPYENQLIQRRPAGGRGSGPAGVAAANWLSLTSQVPATFLAAVPGRTPGPCPGLRFTQRPIDRLLHSLTPNEVAVLEVLRAGPAIVETPWEELPDVIARLAASGTVRLEVLDEAAATEPHRQARARWAEIRAHPKLMPSL